MLTRSRGFAGLVAAAGASARMGEPKALLDVAGRTFVSHAVCEMLAAGATRVVITVPEGSAGKRIAQELDDAFGHDSRLLLCANQWMERGYSGSIQSAWHRCPEVNAWVIAPVDAPFFGAPLITRLMSLLDASHDAAVPRFRGEWGHPIALSLRLRDPLLKMHEHGGPRWLMEALGPRLSFLDWHDPRVTWNLNTPGAYQAAFPGKGMPGVGPRTGSKPVSRLRGDDDAVGEKE